VRILEVELPTSALAAQRAFYGDALGLDLLGEDADRVTLGAGATRLTFVAVPEDPGAQHFAFNVPENRIEDATHWLAGRAPLVPGPKGEHVLDFSGWNADAVYCFDPAGNVVELIARHSLPNASDEPFGPRSLLSVSEVGMPVDDVPGAVAYLEGELGIPVWDGDRKGFTALGDDHGLFIVVPRGRDWFPTDRPATTEPIATTIEPPSGPPVRVR
jgi:catechol-2,3-dioxygenase